MENILEVKGLRKNYKNFCLKDIDFSLPEGCITGFIGINGAGKTTAIHSILNIIHRDSGEIEFFGKNLNNNEREIKDRLGIVFDDNYFYDELTMAEMKSIIAPAYSRWCEKDYQQYMDDFGLNSKQTIGTLSKGMKMKFALTLALSHKAELLIMDEPTSGLDPLIRNQLLKFLKDYMKKEGRGVFFSTHITSDLEKVADMLILIDSGEILMMEEKDLFLDEHCKVKGDARILKDEYKNLFINLQITDYSFTGITRNIDVVHQNIDNIIVERPTIEEVMLAYIERGKNNAVSFA